MKLIRDTDVLRFLPTLITSPDEKIEKALNLMNEIKDKEEIGVLGLHIEGPYISVEKKGFIVLNI